jgi:Skp family chaperone for outer membrane proteins
MLMTRAIATAFLLAFLGTALPIPAAAQDDGGRFKLAVIDVEMIRRNAAAVKDIQSQIGEFRTDFQNDIQKEEEALRKAQQEVARQRAILSPEAFAEERRKFEQNVVEVQRRVQQRKQALGEAQVRAMREVEKAVNEIVAEMVKEHGLSLILKRKDAVFVTPQLEISQVVLERLDKKLPSVKISAPPAK